MQLCIISPPLSLKVALTAGNNAHKLVPESPLFLAAVLMVTVMQWRLLLPSRGYSTVSLLAEQILIRTRNCFFSSTIDHNILSSGSQHALRMLQFRSVVHQCNRLLRTAFDTAISSRDLSRMQSLLGLLV